jgi:YVTN family beta-propeller protein
MKHKLSLSFLDRVDFCLISTLVSLSAISLSTTPVLAHPKNTIVATIPMGSYTGDVLVSPNSQLVYVTNNDTQTVQVIDAATNTVTSTIAVGNVPFGLAISPDGTTLYVTNEGDGTVSVVSTANNVVTATVEVGEAPEYAAVSPDGKYVYVPDAFDGPLSIINTTNKQVTTLTVEGRPFQVLFSQSGQDAYVASVIDIYYRNKTRVEPVITTIDTSTQTVVTNKVLANTNSGLDLAIATTGNDMYVVIDKQVCVFNTLTNRIGKRFSVTNQTFSGISAVTPDGEYLYIPNFAARVVETIDLAMEQEVSTFRAGRSPGVVAIAPNGNYAYVTDELDNAVLVVDISGS